MGNPYSELASLISRFNLNVFVDKVPEGVNGTPQRFPEDLIDKGYIDNIYIWGSNGFLNTDYTITENIVWNSLNINSPRRVEVAIGIIKKIYAIDLVFDEKSLFAYLKEFDILEERI